MTRVQLDLSAREMQRLEYIMDACELSTRKELFGNAFSALEWMVDEARKGRRICSVHDADQDRHFFNLPALQNVDVCVNTPNVGVAVATAESALATALPEKKKKKVPSGQLRAYG